MRKRMCIAWHNRLVALNHQQRKEAEYQQRQKAERDKAKERRHPNLQPTSPHEPSGSADTGEPKHSETESKTNRVPELLFHALLVVVVEETLRMYIPHLLPLGWMAI